MHLTYLDENKSIDEEIDWNIDPAIVAAGVSIFHTFNSEIEEPEGFVIRLYSAMCQAKENADKSLDPKS